MTLSVCLFRTTLLAAWVAVIAPAFALAAPAFPPFPHGAAKPELGRWLVSQTDLPPSAVVLAGSGYVFAFVAPDPPGGSDGLVWKRVREEAVSVTLASRLGGRSATATIAFDCQRNQATANAVTVYPGNNLRGEGRSVPAADWLVANPGLYLMDLAKAACEPGHHPLFEAPLGPTAPDAGPSPTVNEPPARTVPARTPALESGPEHWVQVGAFADADAAKLRWKAIQRMLPTQTGGRTLRVEPAGAKTLMRALAGPFKGVAAQAFCTALKAHGGNCLVR
jgi:hypothetical protein